MRTWRTTAGLSAVALLAVACGSDPGEAAGGGGGEGLSGTIAVDGSSTVGPLTSAIAEEYSFEQPGVNVNLGVSGTGGGFERFCGTGDTDISNASRPIEEEEAELCRENDIEFIEVRVGTDALTMVVDPRTDFVDCLTTDEVATIFGPDDPATNWNEVRAEFPDTPLQVFAPDTDSGTYDFMLEDVLDIDASRQDYNASANDNVIVQGVAGTPGAWGFFGFAFFQENEGRLRALAYDAGDGCVEPSVETAQDGSYEMARPLFIYVKERSLLEKAQVADFVRFYLDNVGSLIGDVGYVPAQDQQIEDAKAKVEAALQG